MKPFKREIGRAAPLEGRNIDTDQILPARFLKQDRAKGYGQLLFHDLRFDENGQERREFVLNQAPFREARILVTEENFGCGSSREGAVYAISDYGFRAVLAPSFGDIFHNNCLKNGVLPVRLPEPVCRGLRESLQQNPTQEVVVDLEKQQVELANGDIHAFSIDPFWRECLLQGVDDLQLTMGKMDRIKAFEKEYFASRPWALPSENGQAACGV